MGQCHQLPTETLCARVAQGEARPGWPCAAGGCQVLQEPAPPPRRPPELLNQQKCSLEKYSPELMVVEHAPGRPPGKHQPLDPADGLSPRRTFAQATTATEEDADAILDHSISGCIRNGTELDVMSPRNVRVASGRRHLRGSSRTSEDLKRRGRYKDQQGRGGDGEQPSPGMHRGALGLEGRTKAQPSSREQGRRAKEGARERETVREEKGEPPRRSTVKALAEACAELTRLLQSWQARTRPERSSRTQRAVGGAQSLPRAHLS